MAKKEFVIPTNPKDQERIKKCVKDAADCLVRMDAEKEEMKSLAELMDEEVGMPKATFTKMVRIFHKQNFDVVVGTNEEFCALYETIFKSTT